ncbi:abscisic acid receptor PYL8 [Tanacetum coccineum]|uniref:Abscisic acid receptor PYL8 n=1 Tax=Tanacetum coccineum TaxID=301880 RepID=A0ABQ5A599_9ASTR
MLDSYTTSMCIESWGRSSFTRCLIEINADDVLKESLTLCVPLIESSGFTIETFTIEYEWKPPRCDLCKIFGHVHDHCPKKVMIPPTVVTSNVATPIVEKSNDGFQTVGKKKKKGKSKSNNDGQFGGQSVKQTVRYEPKATTNTPTKGATNMGNTSKSSSMLKSSVTSTKKGNITMSNSYSAFDDESDEDVENVWSLVRRFDQPQKYKPFVSRCVAQGNLEIGSLREVDVKSGLPATTSTERLELLDDDQHIFSVRIIGGDHRLRNYSSIISVHPEIIEGRPGTLVVESFVVDVPEGNTKDETCYFVQALIKCNLKSLADVSERLSVQDRTEPIDQM